MNGTAQQWVGSERQDAPVNVPAAGCGAMLEHLVIN
jgi:hypothetical protein